MFATLRAVWRPAMYHGYRRRRNFFEGWYFKVVDAAEHHVQAIIPGVFLSRDASIAHAFVQVLDGLTGRSTYHRYPLDQFWSSERTFDIRIGANRFRADRIALDLNDATQTLRGELCFDGLKPWPVTILSPGIMGPYAFVPLMECYHGVVSLDHAVRGSLVMNGASINFDDGRGYIEKDWGQAFPQAWIWAQSNHFDHGGTALTVSVATIPWLGSAFRGFIIGVWHDRKLYRFATYTGARIESLRLTDTHVLMRIADKQYRLEISAARSGGGLLHAPYRMEMLQRVTESLTATVDVHLIDHVNQRDIFAGTGRHAGLEINGEIKQILD